VRKSFTDLLKVAVTALAAVIVHTAMYRCQCRLRSSQRKVELAPATAVRVTTVPLLKAALQVLGQVMPAGLLLTLPLPDPASVTLNANVTVLNVCGHGFGCTHGYAACTGSSAGSAPARRRWIPAVAHVRRLMISTLVLPVLPSNALARLCDMLC